MIDQDLEALAGETIASVEVHEPDEHGADIGGLTFTFESGKTLNLVASGDGREVFILADLRRPPA